MKNVLFAIACLACLSFTQAQHRTGGKKMKAQREMMSSLEPEERATLKTKKMTLALDLSSRQQKGVQTLNVEEELWREEMKESRRAARESSEAQPTKEERYVRHNQVLDQQIAYQQKLREILNEDQYQQWKKMRSRRWAGKKKMLRNGRSR